MPDTINAEAVDVVGAAFVVDTIGSDNYPTSKLTLGADGVDDGFVATSNPLPIQPSDGTALQTFSTADLDTGAGTATRILVGLALPASGGPVVGGTSTNPIRTDPTGSTTQPVAGTVTADAGSGTFSVNTAQIGGTAVDTDAGNAGAGTQRVVIASDQAALDVSAATVTVESDGTVDTGNSTTTPLAGDATFTGEWVDTTNFAHLTLSVFADQDSVTDGLKFQWSSDGSNVDRSVETSVFANTGRAFAITMRARFFRVEYDNGPTLQGAFRLGVVLKRHGTGLITRPIDANIESGSFASTVRGVIVGEKPNGEFANVQASSSGNLKMSVEEFDAAVFGQSTMANSLPVAIASDQSSIQVDTEMPAAAALQDGSANPSVPAVAGMTHVYNGTNWDRLRGNTSGLDVNDISAGTQTNDVKITLDSEVVSINDNSGSITVDNGGTFAVQADSVSGANFSAAESAALPAEFVLVAGDDGTDTHPLQTDASGNLNVNIQAGSASGTEFNEDTQHSTGDAGVEVLAVRNDTLATLVDTDGDYAPFQVDADGALYVNVAAGSASGTEFNEDSAHNTGDAGVQTLAVRNDGGGSLVDTDGDYAPLQVNASGELITSAAVTINSEYAEDSVHSTGDEGTFILGVRNDTLASLVGADGDYAPFQVDADGALYVNVAAGSTSGTEFDEDTQHTTGDAGVQSLAVRNDALASLVDTDGDYTPLQVNASGALYVQQGAALDVSGATVTTTPAVTGGGMEATAQRVTIANDSSGLLSIDDNGGSLTIDNAAIDNAHSQDFDTGAGTDTTSAFGIALPGAGGAVAVDGSNPLPVDASGIPVPVTDNGGSITVDGTVTADAGSGTFTVGNAGTFAVQVDTLTGANFTAAEAGALPGQFVVVAGDDGTDVAPIQVDTSGNLKVVSAAALDVSAAIVTTTPAVTGGGTEAAAQRVTIASDSTGVLSVDDNGGSLTVDGTVDVGSALPAGTNNIGDVDVATQPARAATSDSITAKLATDAIQDGTTALTPKFAAIGTATSGDNTIVAAVATKKIRITNLFILAAGDVDVFFKDGTTGNDIIGKSTQALDLTTNSGFTLPFVPTGWGETAAGEALVMNLGSAVRVAGVVAYLEV